MSSQPQAMRRLRPLTRVKPTREMVLLAILIVLVVVLSQMSADFLTVSNLLNTSRYFVESGLIALGMTLIIITGGIDLSVGSGLALTSVTVGFLYDVGVPLPVAIVLAILVGAAGGLFNSVLITALDLHPLTITLGTFALFRGIAYAVTNGESVSSFPGWFEYFGQFYIGPMPGQLLIFAVAAVAVAALLSGTRFGDYVYAIGSNEQASRFSGVPVARVKQAVYVLTGVLVAIAAIIYTSRVSTARANAGVGLELDVIAAVVLGGASIYGGSGTVTGTVLGVVIIALLRNGLLLAGLDSNWILVVVGLVLIASVFVNEYFRRRES
jgi:rhamnose transport system permease protein